MVTSKAKFERWSQGLSASSQYLIVLVEKRILPVFFDKGFVWVEDYAEGKSSEVGANEIPLQIQSGDLWPTVQISFSPQGKPWFVIRFGFIPDNCYRWNGELLTQKQTTLSYAPASFNLAKDQGSVSSLYMQFGYHWFSFFPKKTLLCEVEYAYNRLNFIFEFFKNGVADPYPEIKGGYASKNIFKEFKPTFPISAG